MATDPRRWRSEAGSVLMLMPAAVVILVVLGAIAVDQAVAFNRQRELVASAQAAANDAASWGLEAGAVRDGHGQRYDLVRADRMIRADLTKRGVSAELSWSIEHGRIVVQLRETSRRVFGGALPGSSGRLTIHARGEAELVRR